ncbi:MAG: DUF1573 domain-containing protein [Candidatus Wildermuthbacteria bacterium]|nr:DUF1573 domain-containing protein [Candidatus Wildermuthbacteria bacterium]
MNKTTIAIIIATLALGGIIWIARPNSPNTAASLSVPGNGVLSVKEADFDFGSISMAAGKVKHSFTMQNTGSDPVVIGKMYTSCMCTTAWLMKGGKQFGPYGMPGHSFTPKINESINPGEEATVEVVFDPAAHGPAGVGKIQRTVIIENNAGQNLEFGFSAFVTP